MSRSVAEGGGMRHTAGRVAPLRGRSREPGCMGIRSDQEGRSRMSQDRPLDALIEEAFTFAEARLVEATETLRRDHPRDYFSLYPTSTEPAGRALGRGKYGRADDWRSGFFPGALFQMYRKNGDDRFFRDARLWTAGIEGMKSRPIDYDQGNRFMCSFGLGYQVTDRPDELSRAFRRYAEQVLPVAAASLDTRYN